MIWNEYKRQVHDEIVGLAQRNVIKSVSQPEMKMLLLDVELTLLRSGYSVDDIRRFWAELLREMAVTRKQANNALMAILALAEQAIAQHCQKPKRK